VSRAVAALAAAILLAACGAATHHRSADHTHLLTSSSPTTVPAHPPVQIPNPAPTNIPAPAADVSVIRSWADALRDGRLAAAARYFALPSEMINEAGSAGGALVLRIHTEAEAVAAQATLSCGARLISADLRGRYVNALFALTGRPGLGGTNCGGASGATARTNFVIADGRIVEWIRAASEPGDRGGPPAPSSPLPNASA
jgi:hypothetical protein